MNDTAKDPQAEIYNRGYKCGVEETLYKQAQLKPRKGMDVEEVFSSILQYSNKQDKKGENWNIWDLAKALSNSTGLREGNAIAPTMFNSTADKSTDVVKELREMRDMEDGTTGLRELDKVDFLKFVSSKFPTDTHILTTPALVSNFVCQLSMDIYNYISQFGTREEQK